MKKRVLWIATFAWAILIYRLTTTPQLVVTQDSVLQMILMSGAHFVFFGILAVLLSLASTAGAIIPITIASLYGLMIEIVQRGIPGRTADPVDWALDTLGAVMCIWVVHQYTKNSRTRMIH